MCRWTHKSRISDRSGHSLTVNEVVRDAGSKSSSSFDIMLNDESNAPISTACSESCLTKVASRFCNASTDRAGLLGNVRANMVFQHLLAVFKGTRTSWKIYEVSRLETVSLDVNHQRMENLSLTASSRLSSSR